MRRFFILSLILIVATDACFAFTLEQELDGVIYGVVMDDSGGRLSGATVVVEGTTNGVFSDADGNYSIRVAEGVVTIKASYVGYEPQLREVSLVGEYELDFVLMPLDMSVGEVVISATRAGNKTPQTYSTMDNLAISKRHTGRDVPFLLSLTPSMVETSESGNGIGATNMRIRGTDANRINVTIDGIPLNDPESQQVFWVNMPDIASSVDNIQIQRGVGTSSNGSGSFGATVSMDTKVPENEPSATINASIGSFNTSKLTLAAGTGLIGDNFAIQVRLSNVKSDGFVYRTGAEHKAAMITGFYRSKKSLLKANFIYGKEHTGIGWWGNPADMVNIDSRYNPAGEYRDSTGVVHYYNNESDNYTQSHFQLSWNYKINNSLLSNLAGFYTIGEGYYEEYKDDADVEDYGLTVAEATVTDLVRQKWMSNDYFGLIYSLKYKQGAVDATFGGTANYFLGNHFGKVIWSEVVPFPGDYRWYLNTGNKGEVSVYGKADVTLGKSFSLYGDLQYRLVHYVMEGPDDDYKTLDQQHIYHFFNPKAGLFYSINEHQDAYLSFSVGNREPTRSDFKEAAGDDKATPQSETMYDTELGYSLKTDKLSASVNGYAMLYRNQLVPTGQLSNSGYSIMTNVERSYRLGVELSANCKIFRFLEWGIGTTLSNNKILDFTEYYSDYNSLEFVNEYKSKQLGTVDIAYSPNIVATSDMNFGILPSLELHYTAKYVGKQYFDNTMSEQRSLKPYFVNNITIDWNPVVTKTKNVGLQFVVNNLFNKNYISNAYGGNWYEDGVENTWAYYFPQAGINFMFRLTINI